MPRLSVPGDPTLFRSSTPRSRRTSARRGLAASAALALVLGLVGSAIPSSAVADETPPATSPVATPAATPAAPQPAAGTPGPSEPSAPVTTPVLPAAKPSLASPSASPTSQQPRVAAAAAPAPTKFTCTANAPAILIQGSPADGYTIDLATGASRVFRSGIHSSNVNAIGYNVKDDFVYGMTFFGNPRQLVRIGANGDAQMLGLPAGLPADSAFHIGDIDDNGQYWLSNGPEWWQINLNPGTPNYGKVVKSGTLDVQAPADWSYVPGTNYLYAITNSNANNLPKLLRFNRTSKVMEVVGPVTGLAQTNAFGATYADSDGFIYGSDNASGEIYRVNVATGAGTLFAQGPSSSANDGARCATSPITLDFGDAPESYSTTLGANGPRHTLLGYNAATRKASLMLGANVDVESDGGPTAGADGDDVAGASGADGVDDEDSVKPIVMNVGRAGNVDIVATNHTAQPATLTGWVDLNGNGTFDNASERVSLVVPANSGSKWYTLTFNGPTTTSDTYARFRLFPGNLTSTPIYLQPTGSASAGEVEDHPVTVKQVALDVTKTSDATADSRPGDVITYTVTARNTGTGNYTAADPARLVDNLAGVLDDATYNADATADRGSAPTYQSPQITWTGALAAGASVTLTYSVTLKGGGDGTVKNVAFGQCDTSKPDCDPKPPKCDPVVGGIDPASGKPCATVTLELPKLSITKTASTNSLPAVGAPVTYTIKVTNTGKGAYTAAEPATFTDDLTAVLDDANLNSASLNATSGTLQFISPNLSWTGALAPGASATITYHVIYTGAGDNVLRNVACVPVTEAADPQDACRRVQIPGSGLSQTKLASPASGSAVESGDVITYTLRFINTGQAPAAVNTSDDLSGVLDDADFVAGSINSGALTASLDTANKQITVTGLVPVGQTIDVTYRVKVRSWANQGDHIVANALQCPVGSAPGCPPVVTTHPLLGLEMTKSSDRTSSTVIGDTVNYTVTAKNVGTADYTAANPAIVRDDLSGVLDDATYNGDAAADRAGGVTMTTPTLKWSGALKAGQKVTLTYSVTLTGAGDHVVRNVTWGGGGTPPACAPPTVDGVDPVTGQPCAEVTFPMPDMVDSKSVNPASGTSVEAGEVLTYTLTFTNRGALAGPVERDDYLGMLLDDAGLFDGPHSSDPTNLTATKVGDRIEIRGTVPARTTTTVTYKVRVKSDIDRAADGGDDVLGNFLINPQATPPTECAPASDEDSTCNPVRSLTVEKSSDRTAVSTYGDKITYTVTATNTGKGDYTLAEPATFHDTLVGVLDDATFNGDEVSDRQGTTTYLNQMIHWTGALKAGEAVTVTYSVTLKRGGDGEVRNVAWAGDGGNPPACDPRTTAGLDPVTGQPCDIVKFGIPDLTQTKSVNPSSGTPVVPGQELTYTLTFSNAGTAAAPVDSVDNLTQLLDDATVIAAPVSSDPALTASAVTNGQFTVTGSLAPKQSVTVTYKVRVKSVDALGDSILANHLLSPGTTPPAVQCPPAGSNSTCNPVRTLEVKKSSNRTAESTYGDTITYTVTAKNIGKADYTVADPAQVNDTLAGVLDDAVYNADAIADQTGTVAYTAPVVKWTGALAVGRTVTLTYSVKLKRGGDMEVRNVAWAGTGTAPACKPATAAGTDPVTGQPCATVNFGIPDLKQSKGVDPTSGSSVVAGQVLTYTLTFSNEGSAPTTVDSVDNLTQLLDDAVVIEAPKASGVALSVTPVTNGKFGITGTLDPGKSVTVSYRVKVNAVDKLGDGILANHLLKPGENPPASPNCPTGSTTSTCNPVSDITAVKSVDPQDGGTVKDGDVLTYTLTFSNRGKGTGTVDHLDRLGDVLDDARMLAAPVASTTALTPTLTGDRLAVTGKLLSGETVTVKYKVRVKAYADQGNHQLTNFLVGPGVAPPTACVAGDVLCTDNQVSPPKGPKLPLTGGPALAALLAGLGLLGGGALLLMGARRRRTS